MAQLTAEHLEQSGFVVMHKQPVPPGPDLHYGPSVAKVIKGE